MKYKIGHEIQFTQSFWLPVEGGKKLKVLKGDKAVVVKKIDDNSGEILYMTGEASGKSQVINIQVDDEIDGDYIARQIMEEL
ncbi:MULTISPECIES: hypothetical protein [Clostridium]|uniref:Uncharacterized protein n=4 Tax=Clostridium TaxID=1485 RepID=D8GMA4_CLOLD|nr:MULTISPECIES: hypothetical protein [Clostridium]ADK13514.1 conserved hypothetical protein [Clostridium ljungdahlii DSM 13528]AGY76709.1 hypothetical protein CAETHG_2500 [Clostridium autoethanogenum DSM 10061]ALU36864.1 Hypothetical protein CLAU_2436 [Clostridium autoethanogenum DSM 10061]OAA89132.1 hypothetical protein WX45_02373 [Clostridium ljungdahlii DSM 13528]OAA94312.1 hypothetical protein WX73_03412 [Clostridium coskatii]